MMDDEDIEQASDIIIENKTHDAKVWLKKMGYLVYTKEFVLKNLIEIKWW